MSAIVALFILMLVAMALMATVMILGLRKSQRFKASARIGKGSFDIETTR